MIDWQKIEFFKSGEFDDPDYPGSGKLIDEELIKKLNLLRELSGWAIIPHSKVGGCVDVKGTHGHSSHSLHLLKEGAKACDFHFADPSTFEPLIGNIRLQYFEVERIGFGGIGVYRDWKFNKEYLPIGFHVDHRPIERAQRWKRENGKYIYLL